MKRFAFVLLMAFAVTARAQDASTNAPEPKRPARQPMTDEQRAQQETHLNDAWNKLSVDGKARLMRLHHALNQMPQEERQFIHDRIERFLNMSPEERQQLKRNAKRWMSMTPEERQKARDEFRQRRQDFEQKWRQDHPGEEPPPFPPHPSRPAAPPPPPPLPQDSEPKTENPKKETP
jgi:hypothetical protein